jgi:hypothetical protein
VELCSKIIIGSFKNKGSNSVKTRTELVSIIIKIIELSNNHINKSIKKIILQQNFEYKQKSKKNYKGFVDILKLLGDPKVEI